MEYMLDSQDVLRYLGYKGQPLDTGTRALLADCMKDMQTKARPRYVYRVFRLDWDAEPLALAECGLALPGRDIRRHLEGCDACALLAATLGVSADDLIRRAEPESMSRAVVLDACAADMIEKVCDRAQAELAGPAARKGLELTYRFSPGYGDLPLELQRPISRILETEKRIGLTATENSLLLPRKSVTALVGFTKAPREPESRCAACSMAGRCSFQKGGTTCER